MARNPFYGATHSMSAASETDPRLEGELDPVSSSPQLIAGAMAVLLSFLCVALLVAWLAHWREGFGLSGDARFNLHPLCMTLAVPLLLPCAVLAWRCLPLSHTWRKAAHVSLNASALALVGFGLFCAFTSQPPPYVFTPHSWLGLASAFLLGLQALGGVLYLIPHGPVDVKAALLPSHAWLGLTAFALSLLTFCSGVVNLTALYLTRGTHHYTAPPSDHSHTSRVMDPAGNESLIACLLGVVALAVLLLTLYAVMPRRAVEWQEGTDVEGSARAWGRPQRPPVSNPFSE